MNPPLALYVHLPWCVRKCPYCDFNSHPVPGAGVPEEAYLRALLDDLEYAAAECDDRPLVSVFFGGGTPSLFSPASIARLLERATTLLPATPGLEVTLEANPGTVEHGAFRDYRAAGVNRVSLGAQSFDDRQLAALGRIHAAAENRAAVAELDAAGLDNFNLDLMYALPGQDAAQALADLEAALALGPAHVSHYQLTLEPGTVFARRPPPALPGEDLAFEIQEACQVRLAAAGLGQYEVSAYARAGRQCRHNRNYWEFGDYLGVGAGAHGKLTRDGRITRTARHRSPARYIAAATAHERIAEIRHIDPLDLPFEFCLNALRLTEGFDVGLYEEATGLSAASLEPACARAVRRGLIERHGSRWVPSPLGRRFLNDLQALFLPEPPGPRPACLPEASGLAAPSP
jgi:putative oxygen-independent coproporphyrinogen III oxidase